MQAAQIVRVQKGKREKNNVWKKTEFFLDGKCINLKVFSHISVVFKVSEDVKWVHINS